MSLHKSQVFLMLWLGLLAGIGAGSFWTISSETLLILVLVSAVVLGVSAYHRTFGETPLGVRLRKLGFLIGCLLLVFVLGVWRFNTYHADHSMVVQFADRTVKNNAQPVVMVGYVDGDFGTSGSTGRFAFRVKEIVVPKRTIFTDERILVRTTAFPEYKYGDILRLEGPVARPTNFSFSDELDYIAYLEKSGIRAIAAYPDIEQGTLMSPLGFAERTKLYVYRTLFSVRYSFSLAISRALPEPHAGFVNGILLGARQEISDRLMEVFKRTGTSHVIALSGYNITIIAGVLMFILLIWLPRRRAFWLAIVGIALFVIMTGAAASVVRAAIMGSLLLFALAYGRLSDIQNAVVLAAGFMALANPFVLRFDAGFQLSFLAVLGLIYISPLISYMFRRMPPLGGIREVIVATISAQLAVLPLILYTFKTFSVVSLLANVIILPLMPAAMLLGFITGVAGLLWNFLGRVVGIVAWAVTQVQLGAINLLSSLPFAAVSISLPFWGMLMLYAVLIVFIVFVRRRWHDKLAAI